MNLLGWADNITAPELFVCDENLNRLQQLTHTNLRPPGFIFRKSELIRYKNSQGKELKGALFYPVNYREGQSYPMIVHIEVVFCKNIRLRTSFLCFLIR